MNTATDAELIARSQDSDREAFGLLALRHEASAYRAAYGVLGHREDAQDAAQETLEQAWRKLAQLKDPSRFVPWLQRIARRKAIDKAKANRVRSRPSMKSQGAGDDCDELALTCSDLASPPELAEKRERWERLVRALRSLKPREQVFIHRFRAEGADRARVARAEGMQRAAIDQQFHRVVKRLSALLASQTRPAA